MKSVPKPVALRRHLAPRQKLWLNWDGVFLMGPNYLRFLAAVDQTGTIREGGRAVGWSYRTCLNRLRRMERVLGAPVLATTRGGRTGGGARLTPEARRLVRVFARWQREVERLTRKAFDEAVAR
ncbi:MAG TPA: LysR family transcriptional regulator [Gemmatimonadales bacterium]|nr:LysR family transcriptional regulator [Gemmatimonadales bacterium]